MTPADGSNVDVLLAMPAHLSSLEVLERLVDEPRISEVFRQGLRREIARVHAARREFASRRGVCWSGLDADPYRVRSVEAIQAEARETEARINSPRGRFLTALARAEEIDPSRVSDIRGLWCRDLADDRQPLNVAAVGAALVLLNAIPGKAARAAIDALACLLMNTSGKAV